MDTEQIEELKPAVKRAASRAHYSWKNLDADDIEQSLWLFILERPSAQKYLLEGNANQRGKALTIQANHICSQERMDYDRYSGNWIYTPREVRALMSRVFGESREDYEVSLDERVDLGDALERMKTSHPRYYKVLADFFVHGTYEREKEKDKRRLQRAIETLAETMNTSLNIRHDKYEKEKSYV